ncbi:MAG: AAA family ATPase [Chloroflexi bacterium]|nr:AAA family ATPase [Chloroflexota bacterium]
MKIDRISRIKGHRVFHAFTWPADLPEFARFNLIYGWNGSGKTTLSNLFAHLERRQPVLEGEVDFCINGNSCPGSTLGTAAVLPRVKVFNRAFIEATVLAMPQQLGPIYFMGQDSVEKQKKVEALTKTKQGEEAKLLSKTNTKATKALEDFCIQQARAIKNLLSSSGTNPYNNYDKAAFKATCARLAKLTPPPANLTDAEKNALKQKKDATLRDSIPALTPSPVDFEALRQKVGNLLKRTVVSQVLEELAADPTVAAWVQQGMGLHIGERQTATCRFCNSPLPPDRLAKLEAHFNDEYNRFLSALDTLKAEVEQARQSLAEINLPDKAAFYGHLVQDYLAAAGTLAEYRAQADAYAGSVLTALEEKRAKPFQALPLDTFLAATPLPGADKAASIASVNKSIGQHNTETGSFHKGVGEARRKLEEGLVSEALAEYQEKNEAIRSLASELQIIQTTIGSLQGQIAALEKEIVEHRRPAEELSSELHSYLGHDELKFELVGNGYQVSRHGNPPTNLSEGERAAIAFLYFLKSLHARDFDLSKDIVVIDDPVSSLDANGLFCAFGYMKTRTLDAGQLFILTHNFAFFRQVKNWFHHLPGQNKHDIAKRPGRFYMLDATVNGGKRNAALKPLDRLLEQYESEYHYLFKRVHDEANNPAAGAGLEAYYGMPNIARRLLESFLAFRCPAETGDLQKQMDPLSFDPAKKARILRLLHTYSHGGKIAESEHAMSVLAETPAALKDLLDLLKAEDPKHYAEMEKLVTAPGTS